MVDDREGRIRDRAYAIWEEEGRPHGGHEDHWRQAEQEMSGRDPLADAAPVGTRSKPTTPAQGRFAEGAALGGEPLAGTDWGLGPGRF